ncbi:MAG: phosphoenolpyruvate kinase [Polyangiaceae bacterium]|jgi:citrate lyase beta subunit
MDILEELAPELETLKNANQAFSRFYPGEAARRQPVHTVYGGAHLFKADTIRRFGAIALRTMDEYGRDPVEFARAVGFLGDAELRELAPGPLAEAYARDSATLRRSHAAGWLAVAVHERVREKLRIEPVEDFRIDFEDGFGVRPDVEEDEVARLAARELARAVADGAAPPFVGIRVKSFSAEWTFRAVRTLEIFVKNLLLAGSENWPADFVVTLPKVTLAEQPRTLARLLGRLEQRHGLKEGALRMELMIEAPQALIGRDGRSPLLDFAQACGGRCVAAHLGTYDLTASCNVTSAHQAMDHPICDLAKGMMLLAYSGTGIFLSDGATNVMPIGPHKGGSLTDDEVAENRAVVHRAWQLSYRHIRRSLRGAYYQGWDLHPAQLPVRYAACFAFFLEGLAQASERLSNFVDKAAQATLLADVFDDAATGQGLLNFFFRALNCGAVGRDDVERAGLTEEEVAHRSFARIVEARRTRAVRGAPTSP